MRRIPTHTNSSYEELLQTIDFELFAHLSRVEFYVRLFCLEMAASGFREFDQTSCMRWGAAAFLHDIGKSRIPKAILMKRGPLSDKEIALVKEHPLYANDMLMALKSSPIFVNDRDFFNLALSASLYHHEWWNGDGYPFGIAGQDIPLIARITSICDAFDAITYGRRYCKARSADEAFAEIKDCASSQFDPTLSTFLIKHKDAFLRYFHIPQKNIKG